jgi:alpha-1,6-mannosyltransferase
VVASASSALPEVIGACGAVAADDGEGFADAVEEVLGRREGARREAARARAECFGWDAAVTAFLAAHDADHDGVAAVRGGVPAVRDGVPAVRGGVSEVRDGAPAIRDGAPGAAVPVRSAARGV